MFYSNIVYNFSIFNYANALAFKSIDDADLDSVQEKVRTVLYGMLNENENGDEELFNNRENAIFFGVYWKNPKQFEFGRGDRKFVRELAIHVKRKVDMATENEGLDWFHRNEKGNAWMKKLFLTPIGSFFGTTPTCYNKLFKNKPILANQINDVSSTLSIETLEANLSSQIEKINLVYAANGIEKMQSTVVHVTVIGNVVKGSAICCFCKENVNLKIFYQKSSKSGCWVKSNYTKHLKNFHGQPQVQILKEKSKTSTANTSNDSLKIIDDFENISSNTNQTAVHQFDSKQSINTVELDTVYKQNVDFLLGQLSKQVISMTNATLSNSEKIIDFHVQMKMAKNVPTKYVRICKVCADGSCLFGALAHQLFYVKLNSPEHKNWTKTLRKQAVDKIKANYGEFKKYLNSRVLETNPNESDEGKIEAGCQRILHELLPIDSFYGGVESMKAISEIYGVNILTINEDGASRFMIAFKTSNAKTIIVSYRNQNHYDSVADIDSSTISQYSKSLAHVEYKERNFKNIIIE